MSYINENFSRLGESYLFAEIDRRVNAFAAEHPEKRLIRLGIGDVTLPLAPAVTRAMKSAVDEMGDARTFRGYGPYAGYDFLREAIKGYYRRRGVELATDEIFVSDGAKSDVGNFTDLFSPDCTVMIPDPVYPVYVDTNVMDGRRIVYADCVEENGFLPEPGGDLSADILYFCSPNNPTGAAYTREGLRKWVDWANSHGAVILYDAAYEAFVSEPGLPRSIYEIPGAKTCAVEFCSLSKTAGFTGTRCGYTVVPKDLRPGGADLNRLWLRRQSTKFNGVSYVVQRGAEAVFSEEGQAQVKANIDVYRSSARLITDTLDRLGIYYTGGRNSPYVWMKCPDGRGSWEFFDFLLNEANVVGTPGAGFGKNGGGFFRLTAFNTPANTEEAMRRLESVLG